MNQLNYYQYFMEIQIICLFIVQHTAQRSTTTNIITVTITKVTYLLALNVSESDCQVDRVLSLGPLDGGGVDCGGERGHFCLVKFLEGKFVDFIAVDIYIYYSYIYF